MFPFKNQSLIILTMILTLTSCRQGGELANESLSGGKLENGSISGEKLADGTVTPAKLDRAYQELLSTGTTAQYLRGDKTFQTLNSAVVPELTNLYYTDARARAAISATAPIGYNLTTGVISLGTVPVANGGTGLTALGTGDQLLGVNAAGTAAEYKTVAGTANQVTVTNAAGFITLSTPQNIHSAASPTFAGLTLTGFGGFVRAASGTLSASALSSADVTTALGFTPVNKAGDTMTGTLFVPSSGLVVGVKDLFFSLGDMGVGTSTPTHKLDLEKEDASTNTVTIAARLAHSSTGIPAAGLGTALDLSAERSDGTIGTMARVQSKWTDPTVLAEDADLEFLTVLNGVAGRAMTLTSSGNVGIGTPVSPHSVLQINGALATAISTKTASYTILATDSIILADATGAAISITLPAAAGISGRQYTVKKIDSSVNVVTVVGTVDGVANPGLAAQWKYMTVVSNGTAWMIIANN